MAYEEASRKDSLTEKEKERDGLYFFLWSLLYLNALFRYQPERKANTQSRTQPAGSKTATLTARTWIPCHSGFFFLFESNSIAIQFCCKGSIMLLAAESLLIHLICPMDLPDLRTALFPSWSIFLQAPNSTEIEDQPSIVSITIIKIYLLLF